MESIGAEVGQKMRSAIKAKLLELNCYVDDELPDYIMVMVANKRTKSQMNEDLNLFLSTKTSTFVDWLHIVLKKLKEVTVTNPELYKKVAKRKTNDLPDVKVKKEKKDLSLLKLKKTETSNIEASQSLTDDLPINANQLSEQRKITILNENRSSEIVSDDNFDIPLLSEVNMSSEQDLQDIEKKIRNVKSRLGLLVESDIEEDLPEIKSEKDEKREVNNVQKDLKKSNYRMVHIQEDLVAEDAGISSEAEPNVSKTGEIEEAITGNSPNSEKRYEHKRITFEEDNSSRKPSILERLGKRSSVNSNITNSVKTRISLSEFRKEEEPFLKYFKDKKNEEDKQNERDWRNRKDHRADKSRRDKESRRGSSKERRRDVSRDRRRDRSKESRVDSRKEGILSRLGVMSKVSLPQKEPEEPEPEDELKTREVRSMVQVKPRVIPSGAPQPNKNLLLKAVAEAQRSVAQTTNVRSHLEPDLLYSKYTIRTKSGEDVPSMRKFSQSEKAKLKNLILAQATQREKLNSSDDERAEEEYIPKPIKRTPKDTPRYIPSLRHQEAGNEDENGEINRQLRTLDGIEKTKISNSSTKPSIKDRLDKKLPSPSNSKSSIKSRLDGKRSPSPIIFDKISAKVKSKPNIPDKLPIIHPPLSVKTKERCKYWPTCRQGDKCEFVHPCSNCEMFPHCKFGDKCLFLHPICKFGSSCTKRDCPYSHSSSKSAASRVISSGVPVKHVMSGLQTCKFFPNCTNTSCLFYHPKPCKFGKYCKIQSECNFSHVFAGNKGSLIWRSK